MALPISEPTQRMLMFWAEAKASRELIVTMLELHDVAREHLRFLQGPVLQHPSPWQADTPAGLYDAIVPIILEEYSRGEVGTSIGPAELTTLIYPATMESPMRYEYVQIYLWASAQAMARRDQKGVAEIWEQVGIKPIEDASICEEGGDFYALYVSLCADVRRRVVRIQSERMREASQQARDVSDEPEIIQEALF